jgi:hypothetical protein
MEEHSHFGNVLEAAGKLTLEEQEALIAVLQRRLIDQRREEIAQEIKAARREFHAGQCRPATPDDLMKEILG